MYKFCSKCMRANKLETVACLAKDMSFASMLPQQPIFKVFDKE